MFGRLINNCCYSCGCNSCGNGCSSACRSCCGLSASDSGTESIVCYCSRFVDVPMNIVKGEGYTALDCCIERNEILQEISDSLHTMKSCSRCNTCG